MFCGEAHALALAGEACGWGSRALVSIAPCTMSPCEMHVLLVGGMRSMATILKYDRQFDMSTSLNPQLTSVQRILFPPFRKT